jgi:hypothetical protein
MTDINTNGTSLRGQFTMPYAKLVELIGGPNAMSDGYKTDVEWAFERDGVVATIYNWKNGPNTTNRGTIEDIKRWNVGGHSSEALDVVSTLLMQKSTVVPKR